MVIGKQFAWAHLPKAGGTTTVAMFSVFDDLVLLADPPEREDAHLPFRDRAGQIEGKLLALNLRRLPTWVLSRAQYVSRHGVHPDFKPIPIDSPKRLAETSLPDDRLSLYMDGGRYRIDRWLRMESLAEDFLSFVSELRPVTDEERELVYGIGALNALEYDREISHWFTPEQLQTLYRMNPCWAALEERLYGSLAADLVPTAAG